MRPRRWPSWSRAAGLWLAAALACLAAPAAAQTAPPAIKFPSEGVFVTPGGEFAAVERTTIRWTVVFDNRAGAADLVLDYSDLMDPIGRDACDGGTACVGAEHLALLCSAPDAPDPGPTGSVVTCDPVSGLLEMRGISVPAGGSACIEFSTQLGAGAAVGSIVGNVGCVSVVTPVPASGRTSPTTSTIPACSPVPPAGFASTCSTVLVAEATPPDFHVQKTVAHDDADSNGLLDIAEQLTWTVTITNGTAIPQTSWVYDSIEAALTFVDFIDNPDGACSLVGNRIECPALGFDPEETKTLSFTTTINCGAATDDDSMRACNEAFACNDDTLTACVASDDDDVLPPRPTCLDFPFTSYAESTKTFSFQDFDFNNVLSAGDRIVFTITVRNRGRRDGESVTVTDVLDPGCLDLSSLDPGTGTFDPVTNTLTWFIASLPSRGRADLSFSAFTLAPSSGECCNQAAITSAERDRCSLPPVRTDDPSTGSMRDPTCAVFGPHAEVRLFKRLQVTDDVNGNGYVDTGDEVEFTVTVVNEGSSPATSLEVEDIILTCFGDFDPLAVTITGDGVNASSGPNPPFNSGRVLVTDVGGADGLAGASAETVTIAFRVRLTGNAADGCCNQATATLAETTRTIFSDDPDTADPVDRTCTARFTGSPVLLLEESTTDHDGDTCAEPGEDITFTLRVTVRDGDAGGVQLTDTLIDSFRAMNVLNPGTGTYDFVLNEITWNLGVMYDDEYVSTQWIGRLDCFDMAEPFDDIATVTALNAATVSQGHSLQLDLPIIQVSKSVTFGDADADSILDPGEIISFVIAITNQGGCASSDIVVTDDLDPDLDWSSVVASESPVQDGAGRLTWTLRTLNGGETLLLTVDAPALDPGANPRPSSDGLVLNAATASVGASWGCERFSSDVAPALPIGVPIRSLDLSRSRSDADGDGCVEPGEQVTFNLRVEAIGGPVDQVRLVETIIDPSLLIAPFDIGLGIYDPGPGTITWDLGRLTPGTPVTVSWTGIVSCAAAAGMSFDCSAVADANPPTNGPRATDSVRVATTALALVKEVTFDDGNGDGEPDPGEVVTWILRVRNTGSCSARGVSITDTVDADVDVRRVNSPDTPADDGAGHLVFDPTTTASLADILPGEERSIAFSAPVLDPGSNPDPAHDGQLDNSAAATLLHDGACTGASTSASAPTLLVGTGRSLRLLRNDFVACRTGGFSTLRAFLAQRPPAQECSEPSGIDPAHPATAILVNPVSPFVVAGDGSARPADTCPQPSTGSGRVIVYYEIDDPPPDCLTSLRVARQGADILVSW